MRIRRFDFYFAVSCLILFLVSQANADMQCNWMRAGDQDVYVCSDDITVVAPRPTPISIPLPPISLEPRPTPAPPERGPADRGNQKCVEVDERTRMRLQANLNNTEFRFIEKLDEKGPNGELGSCAAFFSSGSNTRPGEDADHTPESALTLLSVLLREGKIYFVYDIDYWTDDQGGYGWAWTDGEAGKITINPYAWMELTSDQKLHLIAHEFGHYLAFERDLYTETFNQHLTNELLGTPEFAAAMAEYDAKISAACSGATGMSIDALPQTRPCPTN
jgi:hypothetical protein